MFMKVDRSTHTTLYNCVYNTFALKLKNKNYLKHQVMKTESINVDNILLYSLLNLCGINH